MSKIKLNLIFILGLYGNLLFTKPVVEIAFQALLGNRLFQFCVGKVIAEELGFKLYCPQIWGFPNTYDYINNKPSVAYKTENILAMHDIDIKGIVSNSSPRNIRLEGYFQRYKYFEKYSEIIRNDWLKIDPELTCKQNPEDIVVHIRSKPYYLPFEYYKKALDSTSYGRLFICIDEPNSPFLENFKPYNPIVKSGRSLCQLMDSDVSWDDISKINFDDFVFISSFNKIICSHSTFCWWAAFLSNAQEIYAPYDSDENFQVYGKVNETRYKYIDTIIRWIQ